MTEPPGREQFGPEPGWRILEMPRSFGAGRSFVSGQPEGTAIRIHYFQREHDGVLMAKVWFGPDAEGPPGHAHGGSMAAVLDECMGFSCWASGYPVVAATITINFRQGLPLGQIYLAEGAVARVEGKKIEATGRIYDPGTGTLFSEGSGLFIVQPKERFGGFSI